MFNEIKIKVSNLTFALRIQEKDKLASQSELSNKNTVEVVNIISCNLDMKIKSVATINLRSGKIVD